ncbi:uncharacterized protein H6S33_009051 [Morchella sextelata]|uniref:uncharacterized protein n=1 Tax=Morchella sextelata TaxID=1174677 RepID=UPI001D037EEE|nr:uncharacterized protein H6S33_009051 [Morchella sextelata]KAH0612671.1 hypothetical protein H6S33_009051 [Morchella sextelata]
MPRRRRLTLPSLPKVFSDRLFSPLFSPRLPPTPTYPQTHFQIMSDLHLEFLPPPPPPASPSTHYLAFPIPPKAPYLVLAGDIGLLVPHYERYLAFLRHQTAAFTHVFLVLGNHEFYRASRADGLRAAQQMEDELPGLTVLHRKRVDLPCGVTILGATLHSRIAAEAREVVARSLSDFRAIEGWTVDAHNAEHEADVAWLKASLAELEAEGEEEGHVGGGGGPPKRVLVVTHHAPTFRGTCAPEHEGSEVGSGFCTEVVGGVRGGVGGGLVRVWVYGHTHWTADAVRGGVRIVSNQKGYWGEKGFDVERVVGV